jgi:hypothetical protein
VLAHTTFTSALHKRIKGESYDDHLGAVTRYRGMRPVKAALRADGRPETILRGQVTRLGDVP